MACRGRLLRGMPLLRRLEALGTDEATERPAARVEVRDCGEMTAADTAALTQLATGGDGDGAGAGADSGAGAGAGALASVTGGGALASGGGLVSPLVAGGLSSRCDVTASA